MSNTIAIVNEIRKYLAGDSVALAIVVAILVPIGASIWRAVMGTWPLLNSIFVIYQKRTYITIIDSLNSNHFDDFVELYHETFSEDERVSTEEIQCWLEGKVCSAGVDYKILLARSNGVAGGFAICITNEAEDILYIPYFGVSQASQKWKATRLLAREIYSSLHKKSRGWQTIAMEVLDPQEIGIDGAERKRRAARAKRLHAIAKSVGTKMYRVGAEYIGPPFETDANLSPGRSIILFLMFRGHPDLRLIPKTRFLEIISFIYNEVYLPCYPGEDSERIEFAAWMNKELARQIMVLPTEIPMSLQA